MPRHDRSFVCPPPEWAPGRKNLKCRELIDRLRHPWFGGSLLDGMTHAPESGVELMVLISGTGFWSVCWCLIFPNRESHTGFRL